MGEQSKFLTVREVAEYFNLSISTVYKMIQERIIPHIKVGKNIRIKRVDLERIEEKNYIKAKRQMPF